MNPNTYNPPGGGFQQQKYMYGDMELTKPKYEKLLALQQVYQTGNMRNRDYTNLVSQTLLEPEEDPMQKQYDDLGLYNEYTKAGLEAPDSLVSKLGIGSAGDIRSNALKDAFESQFPVADVSPEKLDRNSLILEQAAKSPSLIDAYSRTKPTQQERLEYTFAPMEEQNRGRYSIMDYAKSGALMNPQILERIFGGGQDLRLRKAGFNI